MASSSKQTIPFRFFGEDIMIIYVDVDDTICTGDMYEAVEPLTDNINKVNEMYNEGHEIIYWTARGTLRDGNWFHITHDQLIDWGCLFHELRMNKPVFDLFIDDKAINSEVFFND